MKTRSNGSGEGSNCKCGGIPADTALQTDWPHGSKRDLGNVHSGHGQNADRHTGKGDYHSQSTRMGLLDVRSLVGHCLPSSGFPVPVGVGERQRRCWPNQESDGGQGSLCGRPAPGELARQCGSAGGLGSVMEKKGVRNGATHRSKSWRSEPSRRRGRDSVQQLVKILQRKNTGPVRLLLQCSGEVCRGGYFLLPNRE
jgi:hypothetical protein